jgi:hypothetical protein
MVSIKSYYNISNQKYTAIKVSEEMHPKNLVLLLFYELKLQRMSHRISESLTSILPSPQKDFALSTCKSELGDPRYARGA